MHNIYNVIVFALTLNSQISINTVLYDYFCSKKNKIKWTGTLEDLKAFVLTEINKETAERTNGGRQMVEHGCLTVNCNLLHGIARVRI